MLAHTLVGPLIMPGVEGLFLVIKRLLAALGPQPLSFTDTVIELVANALVKLNVTSVSFTPAPLGWLITVPAGFVHK